FAEAIGGNSKAQLETALQSENADVVAQAIQLAVQPERGKTHLATLRKIASRPQPANVLLSLVSVLQGLQTAERWQLASAILGCSENAQTIAGETNLTLMTWYGIEPVVSDDGALKLLDSNPKLQQFAVRRMAHEISEKPAVAANALRFAGRKAGLGNRDAEMV